MGQALYRKYRSKNLSEIVGQEAIVTALSNALKTGKISHAYLFSGPRGVGKTSVARILAHQINDIEYNLDQLPIDIIEIDAASNRRIDEIRDLREKVLIAPVSAKYKVYIIDEVHMLTREAFNALLKTLEEPPSHVVFILATTEAHKLPETIVSRTQKYGFRLAPTQDVVKLLKKIASSEKIKIDDKSLQLIAEHSGGSLRDAVSLLDQTRHSAEQINIDIVRQSLGLPPKKLVLDILETLDHQEPALIIKKLKNTFEQGVNANLLAKQLIVEIRDQIMFGNLKLHEDVALTLMQDLLEISSSQQAEDRLEIVLLRCQINFAADKPTVSNHSMAANAMPPLTISKPASQRQVEIETDTTELNKTTEGISQELWIVALSDIKVSHSTLHGVLKTAKVEINVNENSLALNFSRKFHHKRASDSHNKKILLKALNRAGVIDCKVTYDLFVQDNSDSSYKQENQDPLNNIEKIFGKAEVVE